MTAEPNRLAHGCISAVYTALGISVHAVRASIGGKSMLRRTTVGWVALVCAVTASLPNSSIAQGRRPAAELGAGPWDYTTFEQGTRIRVSVVSRDLANPWAMAFVPGTADAENPAGDAVITEIAGRMRLLRGGRVLPEPLADLSALSIDKLFDVIVHPGFASNRFVYFTYMKKAADPQGGDGYWATTAIARGRLDGERLVDIEEIFAAREGWRNARGGDAARIVFDGNGHLYLTSSHRLDPDAPQRLDTHVGKLLRLNDDGSTPADNPFVGRADALPEIWSYGHRTMMGLLVHPQSGALWELENGPHGGDEVNVITPGKNYGWPVVTYGRAYDGTRVPAPWREDLEPPEIFWVPSITVSSFAFYTSDRLPAWQGNLFVSGMNRGRLPGTGHLQRIVFNENGELRREELLNDLRQRIRYVGQGPDGLLYLLTDETAGALLKIEPAPEPLPPKSSE